MLYPWNYWYPAININKTTPADQISVIFYLENLSEFNEFGYSVEKYEALENPINFKWLQSLFR